MLKESDIQKQVIDYLSIRAVRNNFFFFSVPNEGFMQAAMIGGMNVKTKSMMSTHLKKMGMVPGVPDLCILYNEIEELHPYRTESPRTLFIELKTEKGKLSKVQEIVHKKFESVGHDVEVARSLDDVIEILKNYGVVE